MSWGFGDDKKSDTWGWSVPSSSTSDWAFSTGSQDSGSSWAFSTSNNQGSGFGSGSGSGSNFAFGYEARQNWGDDPIVNGAYGPHYMSEALKSPWGAPAAASSGSSSWTPSKGLWDPMPRRNKPAPAEHAPPPPRALPSPTYSTYSPSSGGLSRPWSQSAVASGSGYQTPSSGPQHSYAPQTSYSPTKKA